MISQTIRKFSFAAAAAVVIAGGLQAATIGTDGWSRVAPLGGGFSVSMPGVPEHKTSPLNSSGVTSTMHTYLVDTGRYAYGVFYNDLPFAPASLRETLDVLGVFPRPDRARPLERSPVGSLVTEQIRRLRIASQRR